MDLDSPMKLVFLNPSGQIGGAERSLLDIVASLRASYPDWQLCIVATAEGPLVREAMALGVEARVHSMPHRLARLGDGGSPASPRRLGAMMRALRALPSALRYLWSLHRLLAELSPSVIHTNGFKMHVLGLWARPSGTPVVWHVHDFVGRRPVMSQLLRVHARRCSAVVANSRSVGADVERLLGGRAPIVTVYNGVDLAKYSPEGKSLDLDALSSMPDPGPGVVRVGLVATMGWWKGHETFLAAIARMPRELPWRAYVVGGPLYETDDSQLGIERLMFRANELGIADRMGFTGFVPDSAVAIRALDVVVHASTEPEPFGLVIAEAMACGKAVVVSTAGGAAELISDGENALGHAPGDVEALAGAVESLVRDGALRRRLGEAARRHAERAFDRSRLAGEFGPLYQRAAHARAG